MKKALLVRQVIVLLIALIISSGIAIFFVSEAMINQGIEGLSSSLSMLDYSLDYDGNIKTQTTALMQVMPEKNARITIIKMDGTVVADTQIDKPETMENHLARIEVQNALKNEVGHSIRYSNTVHEEMLYVAKLSKNADYILRFSIPFEGMLQYLLVTFAWLLAGMLVVLLFSILISAKYIKKIIHPLAEITEQLKKIHKDNLKIELPKYQYEELNIIADTTKALSSELIAYIQEVNFQKKIRQEFFSNASHELKTPITSIKGYAELLDKGFVKEEEKKEDFIRRILFETENMTNLINDILMISRLESEDATVTYSMIRLNLLAEEIFDSLSPIAVQSQITLHKECEPILLEASIKQMRELVLNLVKNAMKYNHPGGNVWLSIYKKEEDIVICVKDDGEGISDKNKERIFERFYCVDKGRSKKEGGTGLGLSIVKHVVEYYKGLIRLESTLGKGSTFTIYIPIKR